MRQFILITISMLGRYAVLLLIPPVALVVWAWSLLSSKSIWWMIGLGFPVLVLVLAMLVLVFGMLLAGSKRIRGRTLTREEGPVLWEYWNRASPPGPRMLRQIIVTDDINAAMAERPRFAGLWGRDQTLIIGLGLLILLDRPAVEAVLEHEFAHADLNYSGGLTKLQEFIRTFETFGEDVEDNPSMEAFVIALGFHALNKWLHKEHLLQSRKHEFQADQQSADRLGVEVEARSNLVLEGSAHLAQKLVYDPLEIELRGVLTAPKPPLDRLIDRRADLVEPVALQQAVSEVLAKDPDPESTHPPLKERLANIGACVDAAMSPVGPSALETILPSQTVAALLDELNSQWAAAVYERVSIY